MANNIYDAPIPGSGTSLIVVLDDALSKSDAETAIAGGRSLDLISESLVNERPSEQMANLIGERMPRDTNEQRSYQRPGGSFSFRPRLADLPLLFQACMGTSASPFTPLSVDITDLTKRVLPPVAAQVSRYQGADAELLCGLRFDEFTWTSEGAKESTVDVTCLGQCGFDEASPADPDYSGLVGVSPLFHSMLSFGGDVSGLKAYKYVLHSKNNTMQDGIANADQREHFPVGDFECDLSLDIPVNPALLTLWRGWHTAGTLVHIPATYTVSAGHTALFDFYGVCTTPPPNVSDRGPQRKTISFKGLVKSGTPDLPSLTVTLTGA